MIERLNIKDINQIMDIWLKENKRTHNYISGEYWDNHFEDVKKEILKAEIYVYKEKEEICGFIGLSNTYIAGIFVKKEKQSMGIGRKLIQYCKSKYPELMLSVYEKNERARAFYEREGFKIIKEEIDKATNEKEYVMVWKK
mgnify:FL=1